MSAKLEAAKIAMELATELIPKLMPDPGNNDLAVLSLNYHDKFDFELDFRVTHGQAVQTGPGKLIAKENQPNIVGAKAKGAGSNIMIVITSDELKKTGMKFAAIFATPVNKSDYVKGSTVPYHENDKSKIWDIVDATKKHYTNDGKLIFDFKKIWKAQASVREVLPLSVFKTNKTFTDKEIDDFPVIELSIGLSPESGATGFLVIS